MREFTLTMPTKILFGEGQIKNLGEEIKQYGNRILLLYGKNSIKKNGVFDAVTKELNNNDITYFELGGVDPNPRITTVREGGKICKENNIQFILAVGGGSTIDCAKAISVASKYDGDPWDFCSWKEYPKDALPLGAVLTLSATGSEMNNGSVITNEELKLKIGWGCHLTYPKFSILDPTYTYTVSKHQTACGIVDILTHLYEFYFNTNVNSELSDRISEAIMKTVIKYGPIALSDPTNYEARANLMWSSTMALNGIPSAGKSFDGFNHLVEHSISGIYDVTHGDGLAILAPHWMTYVFREETYDKFEAFGRNVWGITNGTKEEIGKLAIEKTLKFYEEIGMPTKLSHVNVDDRDFDLIIDNTFYEETLGQFVKLTKEDVKKILYSAL